MCRIQYGEEVPYQLADGEVFKIPKLGGSGPDFLRFINLLDSTCKLLFGYWLSYVLDPYRHWQFGFTDGRGVPDCLAIRYAVWERACRAGWCVSEQFCDVVTAFDMLNRPQLFHDIQATTGVGIDGDPQSSQQSPNVCSSPLVPHAYRGKARG